MDEPADDLPLAKVLGGVDLVDPQECNEIGWQRIAFGVALGRIGGVGCEADLLLGKRPREFREEFLRAWS